MNDDDRCPCLSGETYGACCARFHSASFHSNRPHNGRADGVTAPTAEALMRSRYTAFAVGDAAYLLATWHKSTRPATLDLDADTTWRRLDILRTEQGGLFDDVGLVEFEARYRSGAERGVLQEASHFIRENGHWYYVNGNVTTT